MSEPARAGESNGAPGGTILELIRQSRAAFREGYYHTPTAVEQAESYGINSRPSCVACMSS